MQIGNATVDFRKLYIEGSKGRVKVEPKIMDVLRVLTDQAGEMVTRDELIDQVWGVGYGADERLTRAISILRKSFGEERGDNDYIQTIPRKGYVLTATVSEIEAQIASIVTKTKITTPLNSEGNISRVEKPRVNRRMLVLAAICFTAIYGLFYKTNTSSDPNNVPLTVEAGLESIYNFTKPGAIEEAQTIFETILANDPSHAGARAGLSLALIRECTHLERDTALLNRAHSSAEAAYRIDENLGLANIAMAFTSEFKGDFERAHKFYDRADILDPDNILTLEGRARTLIKTRENEAAWLVIERGQENYPSYPHYYNLAGFLHNRLEDFGAAETAFRQLIDLSNGTNSRAYSQLAHTLHHQGNTEDAIQVLQDGLELNQTSDLYTNLGAFLYFQGQFDMAATAHEKTLELSGDTHNYIYWSNLAGAYRHIPGKIHQSREAFDRAIQLLSERQKIYPGSVELLIHKTLFLSQSGQLDQARDELLKLPNDQTFRAGEYYLISLIYENLSERDLSLQYLESAMRSGYTRTEIMNEPDLKNLRQDKRFHLLLAKLGKEL